MPVIEVLFHKVAIDFIEVLFWILRNLTPRILLEYAGEYFPVAYASMKLNPSQAAYAIVERECLTIVWALEKCTIYLYGWTFVIQTDHQPLAFLRTTRLINPRLIRWSLKLQPYQFKIEAIPGKDNVGADFLSSAI